MMAEQKRDMAKQDHPPYDTQAMPSIRQAQKNDFSWVAEEEESQSCQSFADDDASCRQTTGRCCLVTKRKDGLAAWNWEQKQ